MHNRCGIDLFREVDRIIAEKSWQNNNSAPSPSAQMLKPFSEDELYYLRKIDVIISRIGFTGAKRPLLSRCPFISFCRRMAAKDIKIDCPVPRIQREQLYCPAN